MARDSCLARITAGVAVGGAIGGAVGKISHHNPKTSSCPGLDQYLRFLLLGFVI